MRTRAKPIREDRASVPVSERERERAVPPHALTAEQIVSLQRTAGNAATARLLRFTNVSQTFRAGGKYRLSENGSYLVLPETQTMWVRAGVPVPRGCEETGALLGLEGKATQYREVKPSGSFLPDCLHTAEEIIHGQPLEGEEVHSKVRDTGADFGDTHAANIDAAKDAASGDWMEQHVDAAANPSVGQAFVIVDCKPKSKSPRQKSDPGGLRYPYHAAGVVARDGNDAITLEMFALQSHATEMDRGNTPPQFQMYGPQQTFHATWASWFAEPITIVIESN